MKLRLDPDRCTGHGRCYDLAPALFDEDDDGHCVLRTVDVPASEEAAARRAVDNCPEQAIALSG